MYNPNLDNIKDEIVRSICSAILENDTIHKHIIDHYWVSGSSTIVYPINLGVNDVEVQMDSGNRNYYNKAIQRLVVNNPHLFKDGYFCKSDGSCPSFIRLKYSDTLLERIKNKTQTN